MGAKTKSKVYVIVLNWNNYDQTKQNLVRIEESAVSPSRIDPGGTVNLATTYTILGAPGQEAQVTETREVLHNGQSQGSPQVTVMRPGGTYTSRVPLTLPANAERGAYTVRTVISSAGSTDTKESSFIVD